MVTAQSADASGADLDSLLVTAVAHYETGEDGKLRRGVKAYAGADAYTVVEAYSAFYWDDMLREGTILKDQAIAWLRRLEQHTDAPYLHISDPAAGPSEIALYAGLTRASLHFAMTQTDEKTGEPVVKFLPNPKVKPIDRENDFRKSALLNKALKAGVLDPDFMTHLAASAPIRK